MSLGQEPLVTVLTPVYNGEDLLDQCMDLLLNPRETSQKFLKRLTSNQDHVGVNECSAPTGAGYC